MLVSLNLVRFVFSLVPPLNCGGPAVTSGVTHSSSRCDLGNCRAPGTRELCSHHTSAFSPGWWAQQGLVWVSMLELLLWSTLLWPS